MTKRGMRARRALRARYKGFRLVVSGGRAYAVPDFLDAQEIVYRKALADHPAVLSAATFVELASLIDEYDQVPFQQEHLGDYDQHTLFRYDDVIHAVPQSYGAVDLNLAEERNRLGVFRGKTLEEVRSQIDRAKVEKPIEHAGWLPVYEFSGNCGKHPQFSHATSPPTGYKFTSSAPPRRFKPTRWAKIRKRAVKRVLWMLLSLWLLVRPFLGVFWRRARTSPGSRARVLASMVRLLLSLVGTGAKLWHVLCFLRSRNYESQLLLSKQRGLVFLTSMPYTYNLNPWLVEIEDPITLFYPHVQNGYTCNLDLAASPYFPIVKKMLESEQCKGVVTHVESTARMVPKLFGSETIARKVFHVPLGVRLPEQHQRHAESEHVELLFINSWCQIRTNFYLRGGLDVLEAFATLRQRYPQIRLTLRTKLPKLDPYFHRIMEEGWVRVIPRFLTRDEMDNLLAESHVFLLPAARVHIVSLLQAMSAGLAIVASDGWGIEEYVNHERNGLIVKGRYGKVSWADENAGVLREDYGPMHTCDPRVVEGIIDSVSRLVEDRLLRKRLGQTARNDVQTKYCLENWNSGLKDVLDGITGTNRDSTVLENVYAKRPVECF